MNDLVHHFSLITTGFCMPVVLMSFTGYVISLREHLVYFTLTYNWPLEFMLA